LKIVTLEGYRLFVENGITVNFDCTMKYFTIYENGTLTASDGNAVQRFYLGVVEGGMPQELRSEGNDVFSIESEAAG
ncbi:flagellar hook-basal body protein, partial [Bacillus vallismortis]|nr:flagellar hook-basal body protein [Bacillus vallismortis]